MGTIAMAVKRVVLVVVILVCCVFVSFAMVMVRVVLLVVIVLLSCITLYLGGVSLVSFDECCLSKGTKKKKVLGLRKSSKEL
jgi:hypothetical protein